MGGNAGGIYSRGNMMVVTNCTVVGNYGINSSVVGGIAVNSRSMVINNTIVTQNVSVNTARDIGNVLTNGTWSGRNNLIGTLGTLSSSFSGNGNITGASNFMLIPETINISTIGLSYTPTNWNLQLDIDSRAINAGNNAFSVNATGVQLHWDLDGKQRIVNNTVDIGGYEYDGLLAPANFRSTGQTTNSITLAWNAVTGASSYQIRYRETNGQWGPVNTYTTPTTFKGLILNTRYEFQIRSVNAEGNSGWSPILAVSTHPLPPTTAPTDFRSMAQMSNSITLAWNTVTSATEYQIQYLQTGSTGQWTTITITGQSTSTRMISGFLTNTLYTFQICSTNAGGNSDWSFAGSDRSNQQNSTIIYHSQHEFSASRTNSYDNPYTKRCDGNLSMATLREF